MIPVISKHTTTQEENFKLFSCQFVHPISFSDLNRPVKYLGDYSFFPRGTVILLPFRKPLETTTYNIPFATTKLRRGENNSIRD